MARLSSLASVADTRAVLDRFGLSTKKSLGQHFLINDGVVERICNAFAHGSRGRSWPRDRNAH